ncbi:MAG: DNA polymerase subunit beta [Thermoplasmata archaeon HGW-Thermoplasmata-2]|nr:MAG: DNA polymerase subunit beta [Thermoplasmata archaeon HGW-Thermoplasmata-2]
MPIEGLITSDTRAKILSLLIFNPESEFYLREIVRLTEKNANSIRLELNNLENNRLVSSRKEGILRYYSINKNSPIYAELRSIFLKTHGVTEALRRNLGRLGKIKSAFIYGSYARGDESERSDIDLMIVGEIDEGVLVKAINELEKDLGREINYVVMRPDEFWERRARKDPFLTNVLSEKRILLLGEPNG